MSGQIQFVGTKCPPPPQKKITASLQQLVILQRKKVNNWYCKHGPEEKSPFYQPWNTNVLTNLE